MLVTGYFSQGKKWIRRKLTGSFLAVLFEIQPSKQVRLGLGSDLLDSGSIICVMLDIFYLLSSVILLRTWQDREHCIHVSDKIAEVQENLSNLPNVSYRGSKWQSQDFNKFLLDVIVSYSLSHADSPFWWEWKVFVLICGLTCLIGHIFNIIVFFAPESIK